MAKYDDASWHYEGDYPHDLPVENASTHIWMFLAWCIENNFYNEEFWIDDLELEQEISDIKNKKITWAQFLIDCLDEKLTDEDLNEEWNNFANFYYENKYMEDYEKIFGKKFDNIYKVPDTWENYNLIKIKIDEAYKDFIS